MIIAQTITLVRCAIIGLLLTVGVSLQAQQPFTSEGQLFIVVDGSRQFGELAINPSNGAIRFVEFNPDIGLDLLALGYRSTDRLVYGVDSETMKLHRIDANGQVFELTTLTLDPGLTYPAGDITPDGRYFILFGSSFGLDVTMFTVDLEDPGYAVTSRPLPGLTDITDIGFDPLTETLYGHDQARRELVRINVSTGGITAISQVEDGHDIFGVYFNAFGQLLAFGTTASGVAGAIFEVDIPGQIERTASTGPVYLIQDLAAAPYTIDIRTAVSPRRAFPCEELEFQYTIGNGDAQSYSGIDLTHPLPAGFRFLNVIENNLGGIVDITPGQLSIQNFNVPPGLHTLRVLAEVDDIAEGNYPSQATLDQLPDFMGVTRLSDDPATVQSSDPTKVKIVRLEEDSLFINVFICEGDTAFLDGYEYGSQFTWADGSSSPIRPITESGVFVLEALSGCQSALVTFSVTAASCPFTVELEHVMIPKETFPCSEVIFRFVVDNDAGGSYSNIDFLDTLPPGVTLLEVLGDGMNGELISTDPGVVFIKDMDLPFGIDTLELLVEVGDINPGEYKNQGRIANLPTSIGRFRFSDDPTTTDLDATTLVVLGTPTDTFIIEESICNGSTLILDGESFGTDHLWFDGSTEPQLEINEPGSYELTAFNGCEPTFIFFEVVAGDYIEVKFVESVVEINLSDSIQLEPQTTNFGDTLIYLWQDPLINTLTCLECPNPIANPVQSTDYQLLVDNGVCQDSAIIRLLVDNTRRLFFPNVFSPNNDGVNDFFYIQSPDFGVLESLEIIDRWSNQVFASQNTVLNAEATGWNGMYKGKAMTSGVYIYRARITFYDGLTETFIGTVTVLR